MSELLRLATNSKMAKRGAEENRSCKVTEKPNPRKRVAENVEHIESKICKEEIKLVQLKVTQDGAILMLNDKIRLIQSESAQHEQNFVKAVSAYEELKSSYQQDLQMREDTIKKVENTRSICNILEEHYGRLVITLTKCQQESNELFESFKKIVKVVKNLKMENQNSVQAYEAQVKGLKEKLNKAKESQIQMIDNWTDSKNITEQYTEQLKIINANKDDELAQLRAMLKSATITNCALKEERGYNNLKLNENIKMNEDLRVELDSCKQDRAKQESELKQLTVKNSEIISILEKELNNSKLANTTQANFITDLRCQNNELTEKLVKMEENEKESVSKISEFEQERKVIHTNYESLLMNFNEIKQKYETLYFDCKDREQQLNDLKLERVQLQDQIIRNMATFSDKEQDLIALKDALERDVKSLIGQNKDLARTKEEHLVTIEMKNTKIADFEQEIQNMKISMDDQINDAVKTKTMSILSEMKSVSDSRNKIEKSVDTIKKENESLKIKQKEICEKHENAVVKIGKLEEDIAEFETNETSHEKENGKLKAQIKKLKETNDRLSSDLKMAEKKADDDLLKLAEEKKELQRVCSEPLENNLGGEVLQTQRSQNDKLQLSQPLSMRFSRSQEKPSLTIRTSQKTRKADEYDIFSDSSMDSNYASEIPQLEIDRRFDALIAEGKMPAPLKPLDTRRGKPAATNSTKGYKYFSSKENNGKKTSGDTNKPKIFQTRKMY